MSANFEFVKTHDGIELFSKVSDFGHDTWLVIVHGLGEHCERHDYLIDIFKDKFNIFQFDLRGHGKSTGERAFVESFRDYKTDLEEVLKYMREKHSCKKYILFGHSMGGLIVAGFMQKYVSDNFYPEKVFLSAPPAGVSGPFGPIVNRLEKKIFDKATKMPVTISLPGLVDHDNLSHDPEVKIKYRADKRNCMKIHTQLVFAMIKSSKNVFSKPLNLKCPGFCTVGTADKIVSVEALKNYFYEHEKGMSLKLFAGAYHEIHNEVPKYREPYFEHLRESLV